MCQHYEITEEWLRNEAATSRFEADQEIHTQIREAVSV